MEIVVFVGFVRVADRPVHEVEVEVVEAELL